MNDGSWNATTINDETFQLQLKTVADRRGARLAPRPASFASATHDSLDAVCELTTGRSIYFADLRTPEAWERLQAQLDAFQRQRGDLPYVVAMVDGGVPLGRCLDAQRLVNSTLPLPPNTDELETVFDLAATATGASKPPVPELRELVGGDERLVARTPYMYSLFENVELIAKRDLTVLLVGETGTGKTTLARIIHGLSARSDKNFTNVACGTLQTELIDSALFGHVRGAFTGADANKEGKFAAAKDGTILLDEIDILGLHQQARLLRVLETGQYESLGSNDTLTTTARVIVATNEPLKPLMDRGQFRPDLYFRLNQVMLELPPLRNRPLDIAPPGHAIHRAIG